jgi:hypothetical protein
MGRDRPRGESLVHEIERAGGRATFGRRPASLAEVRRLADEVRKATDRLDLWSTMPHRHGRRRPLQRRRSRGRRVNYLAGFLLTICCRRCSRRAHRPDRQRPRRPAGDRFLRRHADPELPRRRRLLPEQAGADHVHRRPGRAQGVGSSPTRPILDLHEHTMRQAGVADEQVETRSSSSPSRPSSRVAAGFTSMC